MTAAALHQAQPVRPPVMNRTVAWLARRGISVMGTSVLSVRGRKSGECSSIPVNLLDYEDGGSTSLAPRGHAQWVRNMRAAGGGELRTRPQVERASPPPSLPDGEKPELLRAYLERGAGGRPVLRRGRPRSRRRGAAAHRAPDHPVFRITIDLTAA